MIQNHEKLRRVAEAARAARRAQQADATEMDARPFYESMRRLGEALADLDSDEGCSVEPNPQGHGVWSASYRAGWMKALRAIGVVIPEGPGDGSGGS